MEQHLIGQKHMKNVQRSKEQSPIKLLSTSVSLLSTTSLNKNFDDTSSLSSDMTTYGGMASLHQNSIKRCIQIKYFPLFSFAK